MEPEHINQVVGWVVGIVLAIITWITIAKRERQLDDPDDDSVVYLDELQKIAKLQPGGRYLVRILRQSGNLQKDDQEFLSEKEAIDKAVSTLKRAKIEYVFIEKNTSTEFIFRRPYYSHGGSAEGKKVGCTEIYKIE